MKYYNRQGINLNREQISYYIAIPSNVFIYFSLITFISFHVLAFDRVDFNLLIKKIKWNRY